MEALYQEMQKTPDVMQEQAPMEVEEEENLYQIFNGSDDIVQKFYETETGTAAGMHTCKMMRRTLILNNLTEIQLRNLCKGAGIHNSRIKKIDTLRTKLIEHFTNLNMC